MNLKIVSQFYSSVARMVSKMEDESLYDVPEAIGPGLSIVLGIVIFIIIFALSVNGLFRRLFKS